MILAADQLVRGDIYQGRYLQGTDIEVREVTTGDIDRVARVFLNQRAGETFRAWRGYLHALATEVARTRLYLMCDRSDPVALAAVTAGDVLDVPICRVRRGPAEPTLARQLLGWLRDNCIEERSEEHTSELQSLMRISYAVFCLKQKKQTTTTNCIQ